MIQTLTQKETEKRRKYKDLEVEFSRLWKLGTKIVPVIIGASEGSDQNLQFLPGQRSAIQL
jgi:hypothetical protein